jgi:cytochrome bd-type quinol oxidase subunit 1
MKTAEANSPSVTTTDIWISLIAFVLIYIVLGAADLVLMLHYSRKGLADEDDEGGGQLPSTSPALSY